MDDNNIAISIKRTSDLIEKCANSELEKYNLTLSQARILSYLVECQADSLSLKALEKLFGVSQATMQGVISRLSKKGLVATFYAINDRKTKYVCITNQGKMLVDNFSKDAADINRIISSNLSNSELEQLNGTIRKIYKTLKSLS